MSKNNELRTKRQRGIVGRWLNNNGVGTLEAATGFGKTRVGLLCIKNWRKRTKTKGRVLIVNPSEFLRDQWLEELKEYDLLELSESNIINSIIKGEFETDLLVLDEIHRYTAKKFGEVFKRVKYTSILGLTALIEGKERKRIINTYAPVIDRVLLEECRLNKWVSDFDVYNLGLDISDHTKDEYNKITYQFNNTFSFFEHNFNLAMACLKGNSEASEHAKKVSLERGQVIGIARKWMNYMTIRKEMLYGCPEKIKACVDIYRKFEDKQIITFSQKTDTADLIRDAINKTFGKDRAVAYHTGIKGKQIIIDGKKYKHRDGLVEYFKRDEYPHNLLATAKALDEGANIPHINLGIITDGTSTKRQNIQRWGRTLRYIEGEETIIIELYIKDTKDEDWLRDRQEGIPRKLITYIDSLDEIEV